MGAAASRQRSKRPRRSLSHERTSAPSGDAPHVPSSRGSYSCAPRRRAAWHGGRVPIARACQLAAPYAVSPHRPHCAHSPVHSTDCELVTAARPSPETLAPTHTLFVQRPPSSIVLSTPVRCRVYACGTEIVTALQLRVTRAQDRSRTILLQACNHVCNKPVTVLRAALVRALHHKSGGTAVV